MGCTNLAEDSQRAAFFVTGRDAAEVEAKPTPDPNAPEEKMDLIRDSISSGSKA
tara:strand:- start:10187 stop:10348 length:162 start_codon:yes stop_codon:yes gene_type:complete